MRPRPQYTVEEDGEGGGVIVIRIPILVLPRKIEVRVPTRADVVCSQLSPREKEVYALLMQRRSDKEVAAALHISVRTAKYHVARILRKSHCETRAELWFKCLG